MLHDSSFNSVVWCTESCLRGLDLCDQQRGWHCYCTGTGEHFHQQWQWLFLADASVCEGGQASEQPWLLAVKYKFEGWCIKAAAVDAVPT